MCRPLDQRDDNALDEFWSEARMKIELMNIEINNECFNPTLRITIRWEYTPGVEALTNVFGNLIYDGKIIGKLDLVNFNSGGFTIDAQYYMKNTTGSNTVDLFLECVLNRKVIRYINDTRKNAKNGDVLLRADISLLYLDSRTFIVNLKKELKLSAQADINLLSTLNGNSYLEVRHIRVTIQPTIKASDWINDYTQKLGLGEFQIVEIPKLNLGNDAKIFDKSLEALEMSKKHLYDLKMGSAMTALRNSLRLFNETLINLGYTQKKANGDEEVDYGQIFNENKNVKNLTQTLQKNLYGASSRGNDLSSPHIGEQVEGYEIESMISMTYSLYKMVFEKLQGNGDLRKN